MKGQNKYNIVIKTDVEAEEYRIRKEATERAKKNDRIIGEGYAERHIADTLSKVEKINTEL